MSLQPTPVPPVPDATACVARAAFPKGTLLVRMRDALGAFYDDDFFAPLFPVRGRPAEAPWRLALVSVMQFAKGLSACDDDTPHLVVHVVTTGATEPDLDAAWPVHEALEAKGLLPAEHYPDGGYVDADLLVRAPVEYGVEVVGPVRPDVRWQATEGGYDVSQFAVDWDRQRVTSPEGKESQSWGPRVDNQTRPAINVKFSRTDCRLCASRARGTRANGEARHLTLRPESEHEALQRARAAQKTPEWKDHYNRRAGVEGTVSHGVRRCGLRQARYRGLAKTHLQHVLTASAMNVVRAVRWPEREPLGQTRTSPPMALAA